MKSHTHIIHFQYLGFRYHGWQRQPGVKTVQEMVERTLSFVLEDKKFKVLASSRTDKLVSANHSVFQLIVEEPLPDDFFKNFNKNLPNDIRALKLQEVKTRFNIIQDVEEKEYHYHFSFGAKNHPFNAPFLVYIEDDLDIGLMKEGASLFAGSHNFERFGTISNKASKVMREINSCTIEKNLDRQGLYFPESTYVMKVAGPGFMRNQIRYMMGSLFALGMHDLKLTDIKEALENGGSPVLSYMAPPSGLVLERISFTNPLFNL